MSMFLGLVWSGLGWFHCPSQTAFQSNPWLHLEKSWSAAACGWRKSVSILPQGYTMHRDRTRQAWHSPPRYNALCWFPLACISFSSISVHLGIHVTPMIDALHFVLAASFHTASCESLGQYSHCSPRFVQIQEVVHVDHNDHYSHAAVPEKSHSFGLVNEHLVEQLVAAGLGELSHSLVRVPTSALFCGIISLPDLPSQMHQDFVMARLVLRSQAQLLAIDSESSMLAYYPL